MLSQKKMVKEGKKEYIYNGSSNIGFLDEREMAVCVSTEMSITIKKMDKKMFTLSFLRPATESKHPKNVTFPARRRLWT